MVTSKNEFSTWFQFDSKMIHIFTFLCLSTLIVNPAGEKIDSSEFIQIDSNEEIWLHIKLIEQRERKCNETDSLCDVDKHQSALLVATQIAISGALVVGILTIFVLFWKLCKATNRRRPQRRRGRTQRNRPSVQSETSVDSFQRVVIERLRNAPPNYTRAMLLTPDDTPPPYNSVSSARTNPAFDMDYNTPPPSYSAAIELESSSVENIRRSSNKSSDEIRVDLPKECDETPDPTLHI